ncbi:MAG: PrsW family glutamic-type intramembrane protease [Candidatus Micrarchaeota archaeon]
MIFLAVFLVLLLSSQAFAQTAEENMYGELFGVLSYLGVLLLSFLFTLIAAIPFIEEVMGKKKIDIADGPISDRRIWILEAIIGLFLVSLTLTPEGRRVFGGAEVVAYTIAAICALLPFVIFTAMAFISNVYRHNLLRNIFSLMLWGVFAGGTALFVNQTLEHMINEPLLGISAIKTLVGTGAAVAVFTLLAAFFEEALKGLGLAGFIKKKEITPALGMLYGFSIGVGFSMLENWLYFSYGTTPASVGVPGWTQILFYRSFFTTMAHGFFTAFNAYVVCSLQNNKAKFGLGLATAFILHLAYNAALLSNLGAVGPFIVLGLAFVFLYLIYSGMVRERKRATGKHQ